MELFNKKKDAPKGKTAKKRGILFSPGTEQDIIFGGYTRASDNEDVRKCIHVIADLVSDMTIMLLENGEKGDIRIKNGLSYKIDVQPNKMLTRKLFIYRIASDMMKFGNSVVLPRIEEGLISDLELMYMPSVTYSDTTDGYVVRYKGKTYGMDDVLNFIYIPGELRPYIGEGLFYLVRSAVDNLGQAEKTKSVFLKSKWKPSVVFSVVSDAEELTDSDKRQNIVDSYVSETEEGRPWIVPADEIKIDTIKPLSLNDLGIHESIKLEKQVIAAATGVPAFLLGVGEFNKDEYNNFISTKIYSFAQIIQQEMTKKLLLAPNMYFKFNPRSLMMYDLGEKTQHVKDMVGLGMMNRNEGRNQFDYSPVDAEGMDDYSVLENYIPVDKIGEQKKLNELLQKSLRSAIIELEKRYNPNHDPKNGQFTEGDGETSKKPKKDSKKEMLSPIYDEPYSFKEPAADLPKDMIAEVSQAITDEFFDKKTGHNGKRKSRTEYVTNLGAMKFEFEIKDYQEYNIYDYNFLD